jgi:hypothetical protein
MLVNNRSPLWRAMNALRQSPLPSFGQVRVLNSTAILDDGCHDELPCAVEEG